MGRNPSRNPSANPSDLAETPGSSPEHGRGSGSEATAEATASHANRIRTATGPLPDSYETPLADVLPFRPRKAAS